MKNNFRIISIVIATLLLTLTFSCKKEAPKVIPTLTTTAISSITSTTATGGGSITSDGGSTVTARGVCWSLSQSPTTSDSKTSNGAGIGSFISSITGLTPGATYYLRAYATNSVGTAYGSQGTLVTIAILPILTTTALSAITSTTATSGGVITNDGGSPVTVRGVCWSTSQNPTTLSAKTTDGAGTGDFISSIIGLTPGTTYYVRAYATNSIGTAYGDQLTLSALAILPTIATTAITAVTATTATSGGNITSDGGASVTAKGVCWSTLPSPTILLNSKTTDGAGTGSFISSIIGLTPGTTYYVRAYATNSAGTGYGNQLVSTTMATLPTITTTAVTAITDATASSGGNITFDGGASVTSRGVCWSTSQNPTIVDNKTMNGMGSSSFISSITGLSPGTTYYIRAYATNSMGTGYGNQVTAITLAIAPTVTTLAVSPTTETTATGGGNITIDGGSTVTSRGVCWSTNQTPTILNNRTLNGTGTGSFTSILTGLTTNTIYYVRSFATNAIGTSYGGENSVILYLNSPGPNVTDVDGNLYHSVKIGSQIWTVENLKTTKYNNGNSIGTTTPASLDISAESTPKYQWAWGGNESNVAIYGRLYTWYVVTDSRGICPTGWHLPNDAEWTELVNYLGGLGAGGKLKETGTGHWESPNLSATNSTGFTALPGGGRDSWGRLGYFYFGVRGRWWVSNNVSETDTWSYEIYYEYRDVGRNSTNKSDGWSVRCVKD